MRCLILLLFLVNQGFAQDPPRKTTNLNGEWAFHREGSAEKKTVTLPTHWETHEGLKFDGIGWYEKTIELSELSKGRRLLLHFDAVATHATVYWNDKKLGEHLGAWTPFRFDVTEHLSPSSPRGEGLGVRGTNNSPLPFAGEGSGVRGSASKRKHTIRVRVDEKVGHNTQGFLPIIAPHFGGIWQGVRLEECSRSIDESKLAVRIDTTGKVELSGVDVNLFDFTVKYRVNSKVVSTHRFHCDYINLVQGAPLAPNQGTSIWVPIVDADDKSKKKRQMGGYNSYPHTKFNVTFQLPEIPKWSPNAINIIDFVIENTANIYHEKKSIEVQDVATIRYVNRTIETKGDQFLLNGQPLSIRGVLNWGYYPPSLAPTPTEEQWRSDLKLIKSWGFNLMKCCLWVPPKRLLEIADEEGVLIWLEYPTWHPKLTPQYHAELMQEYKEFHELDRNHPSVILRSLTCETGPGADIKVIQSLYDQCKKMCGGLVVDDSSWIEWNRVFDFYDDHPYGNNHTWVATLDRLKKYIATSKYGVKPLCLGEAIAADTWVPTKPMLEAIAKAKADPKQAWSFDERGYPFWVPGFFDANRKWLERLGRVCGEEIPERDIIVYSYRYAEAMRKYQVKIFRKELPHAGYVVSVLRDFPLASMGLLDYQGEAKLEYQEWMGDRNEAVRTNWDWHGERMVIPVTPKLNKGFPGGSELSADWWLLRSLEDQTKMSSRLGLITALRRKTIEDSQEKLGRGDLKYDAGLTSQVVMKDKFRVPSVEVPTTFTRLWALMGPGTSMLSGWVFPVESQQTYPQIVQTQQITVELLNQLEAGVTVLLRPDGKQNSFPLRNHWFLRGGPFVNHAHPLIRNYKTGVTGDMLIQLQHFDLASDVIPDINYLEEIDPILMLWDNHDIKEVKTHGLVFETRVGKGRLLVSALNHQGETNAAGKWLLQTFLKHLDSGPPPRNAFKPETIARMRAKLNEKKIDLTTKSWQFMPDGKNEGLKLGWEKSGFDDTAWKPIKIGQHWEGQGHNALDGWAWYRVTVDVPKDWASVPPHPQPLSPEGRGGTWYLNTEGVDDAYEIYVNGTMIGSGGDIPNKKTAFEDRTAHSIPANVLKPGEKNVIVVRVYDWYGAGGIHRPMTLGNVPIGGVDILK